MKNTEEALVLIDTYIKRLDCESEYERHENLSSNSIIPFAIAVASFTFSSAPIYLLMGVIFGLVGLFSMFAGMSLQRRVSRCYMVAYSDILYCKEMLILSKKPLNLVKLSKILNERCFKLENELKENADIWWQFWKITIDVKPSSLIPGDVARICSE